MMYSKYMSVTVSVGGKILREIDNTVALPFGSEYAIRIKNLNTVRALVKVSVDGTDATQDVQLIVPANGEIALERFIKNGNHDRGNRFKFIERTSKIEDHRGIKGDDGLIRVEFWFEKLPPKVERRTVVRSASFHQSGAMADSDSLDIAETSFNDAGITVAGSESRQKFRTGSWFPTESESNVIILKLRGKVGEKPVVKAISTSFKPSCSTCGKTNKATSKFCSECGTALELL